MVNILLDQSDVAQALVNNDKADVLEGYVTEMLRIDPQIQGIYREAKASETVGSTSVNTGDLVYLNISSANMNVSFGVLCLDSDFHGRFRSVHLHNPRTSIILVPRRITSTAMF